ncbi:MAG: indolepyruvate oxidoreductase subunit beta [bacterium]
MKKNSSRFNLVIAGVGGQGLITLLRVLAEAAIDAGFTARSSELHGLSQRGGSVEVHLRFGNHIDSPLVKKGGADLIVCLEAQESLKVFSYASKEQETVFLLNDFFQPIAETAPLPLEEIKKEIERFSSGVFVVPASETCRENFGTDVVAGIYLLGYAVSKNLIPLDEKIVVSALEKTIPPQYLELNLKAFRLAAK